MTDESRYPARQQQPVCPTLIQCGGAKRRKTGAHPHNLAERGILLELQCASVSVCLYAALCTCCTWEDVDVDDGEGVCVDVDDNIHTEQGHAQLNSELPDQSSHGLRAGRGQAWRLLIELEGQEERAF